MAGLYIHIPFCKQACHYCDFHFSTNQTKRRELVDAICKELILQKNYLGNQSLKTIYYGGGTPSILTPEEIDSIQETIRQHYPLAETMEVTLEANPDDLSLEKLQHLRQSGINRLSIGIQSFDDAVLTFLNRAHYAKMATDSFQDARNVGFHNISIDLIYAIPGQDHSQWKKNIEQALALNPEHVSAYSLTIEEKTVFGKWSSKGKLEKVPDELAANQMEMMVDILEKFGYEHYEVSNFSKPNFHAQHNSNYWKQEHYLGVGPSAHSYNGVSRQYTISNNAHYMQSLHQDKIPFEIEQLTREDKINEYLLTTLRTSWGCDLEHLITLHHYDVVKTHEKYLDALQQNGLAFLSKNNLTLTRKGLMLADKISSDLFA